MGWLRLIIKVTPIFFNEDYHEEYIEHTMAIVDWLVNRMYQFLRGYAIRYNGTTSKIKGGVGLETLMDTQEVYRFNRSYFSSITIMSSHASFVEFGTGMHGELNPVKHVITSKTLNKWGKPKVMHFENSEVDHFYSSIQGQYPKPFMRAAVMGLKRQEGLLNGYTVELDIVYPKMAGFKKIMRGKK